MGDCCTQSAPPKIKVMYNKGDYTKMKDEPTKINWDELFHPHQDDVNAQWDIFRNLYEKLEMRSQKKVFINGIQSKKHSIPLDSANLRKIKRKNKLWSKIRKDLASEEELQYKKLRNQIRRLTKKAKKLIEKQIAKVVKNNPKKIWGYTQRKLKTCPGIPDLNKGEGQNSSDLYTQTDAEKASEFLRYFSSVFTVENWTMAFHISQSTIIPQNWTIL